MGVQQCHYLARLHETLTEERSKQLWEEASKHRGGGGMEHGVDMTVSNKHYNRLVKEGKTAEASALMSIQTGALWSPQRLHEAQIPTEEGAHTCPLCGMVDTDEGHLFWDFISDEDTIWPCLKNL